MDIEQELSSILNTKATSPFLFLGSGFSRRYIGLEKWEDLLKVFAEKTNKPFGFYKSSANGILPLVASLIATEFHKIVWEKPEFENFIKRNGNNFLSEESALKFAISEYILSKSKSHIKDYKTRISEIDILRKLNIDGIITTNWDIFIDQLFSDYKIYVGQEELLFSDPMMLGEIYKIHGSVNQPESIVVTKKDYDSFVEKNPYLAAKLITIFVEHPIIFIGYSLNDPNITALLSSIVNCLNQEKLKLLQNNLIFIEFKDDPNCIPSINESAIVIKKTNIPITIVSAYDFEPIYKSINTVRRKIPTKILRSCKEQFYQLVLNNDPKNKLAVIDGTKIRDKSDIEFYMGVGVVSNKPSPIGYSSIGINEILQNILGLSKTPLDADSVLTKSIPDCQGYVPRFKFLKENGINSKEDFDKSKYNNIHLFTKNKLENQQYKKMFNRKHSKKSVNDIITTLEKDKACLFLIFAKLQEDDKEKIKQFLINNFDHYMIRNGKYKSNYRKLACYYDLLEYGW